jgi:hypothetical protein
MLDEGAANQPNNVYRRSLELAAAALGSTTEAGSTSSLSFLDSQPKVARQGCH